MVKLNLVNCVKNMIPLRIFQVEKMVVRSTLDSTIMMNDASEESHVEFRKELIPNYIYECKEASMSHYVYYILEILCFQCGFFTYDQIRK